MQGLDVLVRGRVVEPRVEQQLLDALVAGDALARDARRVGRLDLAVGVGEAAAALRSAVAGEQPMPRGSRRSRRAGRRRRRRRRTRPSPRRAASRSALPIRTRMPSPEHAGGQQGLDGLARASSWDMYALHWTMGNSNRLGVPPASSRFPGASALHHSSGGPPSMPVAKSPSRSFSGESGSSSAPSLKRPCAPARSPGLRAGRARSRTRARRSGSLQYLRQTHGRADRAAPDACALGLVPYLWATRSGARELGQRPLYQTFRERPLDRARERVAHRRVSRGRARAWRASRRSDGRAASSAPSRGRPADACP